MRVIRMSRNMCSKNLHIETRAIKNMCRNRLVRWRCMQFFAKVFIYTHVSFIRYFFRWGLWRKNNFTWNNKVSFLINSSLEVLVKNLLSRIDYWRHDSYTDCLLFNEELRTRPHHLQHFCDLNYQLRFFILSIFCNNTFKIIMT